MISTLAYADRGGVIKFTQGPLPRGCLPIARGGDALMDSIKGAARWAYDNETPLVPGVPEAPDDMAALRAFNAFRERFEGRHG